MRLHLAASAASAAVPAVRRWSAWASALLLAASVAGAHANPSLYLHASGVPSSTMSATAPTSAVLANHDPGRDAAAGLFIHRGGASAGESDAVRYQRWLGPSGGMALNGTVELRIWAAMKDFRTDKGGAVTAYLRNCNSSGAGCSLIASVSYSEALWNGGKSGWMMKTLSFGSVVHTLAADRLLELKLIVPNSSEDDMWFAYASTGYPSALVATSPAAAVDHYELSLPSTGISCLASSVSVTACANSSSPCSNPATGLSGQTATLASSAGTLAASTLVFDAAGQASTTLRHAAASNGAVASVTLSGEQTAATNPRKCCPDGSPCAAGNSCAITYTTAGFIIAAGANGAATTLPTQTAGTASGNYTLRAIKTNTATRACEAALAGANTVNWAYECSNPAACSASNLLSINGGTATTVQRNHSAAVTAFTAVAMGFDANGNAPFNFTFSDVGQINLWAIKTVDSAALTGSSNAFVSKPAGFALSAIAQAAAPNLANPAAASAAGAKFVKAGESFGASVTALTSNGAAAPNFGKEASPEGVLLTATLVLPAGGATGTLANASIGGGNFSSGVASVSTLAWSEVGILTLTPNLADADYLGAGPVNGTPSGNIGRFIPDHFALTTGSATPACSAAFSYFGQDGFATSFTLRAEAIGNSVTQNYSGSFARLDANQWSAFGFSATGLPAGTTLAASATPPSGSWANGVASINARHQVSRPPAPVVEAGVTVRAAPVDADGVALANSAVAASTPLRFGRLRLSNAFGSARASLQLPVVAEHWSGNAWVLNSADSCTSVPAASVALSNPRNASGAVSAASTSASAINLASGSGLLSLAAPSPAGSSLTLDLALNLGSSASDQSCHAGHPASTGAAKPWLRAQNGSCATSADRDPAARASFGIYSPESRKTVHVRELF